MPCSPLLTFTLTSAWASAGVVNAGALNAMAAAAAAAKADGVPGVLLFGLPDSKDATGSKASDPDAPVQNAVRALKREVPELVVITDVCLCEYTSHGHCGILEGEEILNDVTVAHVDHRCVVS